MKVAVVGGDLRQCYLARTLADKGYEVSVHDLICNDIVTTTYKTHNDIEDTTIGADEKTGKNTTDILIADTIDNAVKDCTAVVLPTPVTDKWSYVAEFLSDKVLVFGWNVPSVFSHFKVYDFRCMNEVALRNAVATAEGTLAEAIKHGSVNISGSRCLILGYGRCGREIASIFRAVGAYVTVADRNKNKREDAIFHGMDAYGIFEREDYSEYDFVINTVPARVLGRREIDKLGKDVVIIDIASVPGGTDFVYCKEQGIKAVHCLGLPGKYSPKTSGEVLGIAVAGIIETFNNDRK